MHWLAAKMEWRLYFDLFTFTAGALLYLFLVVLLGGLRKPRLPESLLFFGWIALFLFYAGGLLALNLVIEFVYLPPSTTVFAAALILVGLVAGPPLLVHSQIEFLARERGARRRWMTPVAALLYLPVVYFVAVMLRASAGRDFYRALEEMASAGWRAGYGLWLALAFTISAFIQWDSAKRWSSEAYVHAARGLGAVSLAGGVVSLTVYLGGMAGADDELLRMLTTLLVFLPVVAGGLLAYVLIRESVRGTGFQRSLVYSVVLAFVALLYLTLARRLSEWLRPLGVPPEATVSMLLFVFVLFLPLLQRRVTRVLENVFRRQAEKLQQLVAEIQMVARTGNLEELVGFAESRIRETLDLVAVRILLREGPARPAVGSGQASRFALRKWREEVGALEAFYHGQSLSGETSAALEYLADQLPAAMDLCRLLDTRARLERELADRKRLALAGAMTERIAHNLRNPLSAMKTILQLQMENAALPSETQEDLRRVLEDTERLNQKLSQLLNFVRSGKSAETGEPKKVDIAQTVGRTVAMRRHEAGRRGVHLEVDGVPAGLCVEGSEEALHDVLENLLGNAFEAVGEGGRVQVSLAAAEGGVRMCVTDSGPGISEAHRARIFEPYFTTKSSGTGLGLAIVQNRVKGMGGAIECESPVADGRGTRFTITLPLAVEEQRRNCEPS